MIKKNIFINVSSKLLVSVLSIIFAPVYLRMYGVEAYGLVAIFGFLQSIFVMADLGLTSALLQHVARLKVQPNFKNETIRIYLTLETIFIGIGIVFLLFFYFNANYFVSTWIKLETIPKTVAVNCIKLMSFAICLQAPFILAQAALIGLEKFSTLNSINLIVAILRTLGVIVVYKIDDSIESFFLWNVIVTILQTTFGFIFTRNEFDIKITRIHFNISSILPLLKFASGGALITITGFVLTQADKFILTKLVTVKEFGLYSLASVVAGIPSLIAFPLKTAIQPRLIQLRENKQDLEEFYETSCAIMSAIITPVSIMLIFFPAEILFLWTGNPTLSEGSSALVTVLSCGTLFMCLMLIPFTLQMAYEWTSITIYSNLFSIIIFIPFVAYLVEIYGILGAAFLILFVYIFQFFIITAIIHSRIFKKINVKWYWDIFILPTIVLSSISFIAKIFIHPMEYRWENLMPILLLGVTLATLSLLLQKNLRLKLLRPMVKTT